MSNGNQEELRIDSVVTVPLADRLAGIHRASGRIRAENEARDRTEVPFIAARLATEAAATASPGEADVRNDESSPTT